jgi:hypothetical protein
MDINEVFKWFRMINLRHALDWNPQGVRKRGRTRKTWKRTTERDLQKVGISWKEAKGLALRRPYVPHANKRTEKEERDKPALAH